MNDLKGTGITRDVGHRDFKTKNVIAVISPGLIINNAGKFLKVIVTCGRKEYLIVARMIDELPPGNRKRLSRNQYEGVGPTVYSTTRTHFDVLTRAVGGIGMASHDPRKSPYGWHIVKRIK